MIISMKNIFTNSTLEILAPFCVLYISICYKLYVSKVYFLIKNIDT